MPDEQLNRRLAAILAADIVGYSKLMAADEAGTLSALKAHRENEFNPFVERHRGRIVKLMGDGTLVEFGSVVDAVKCALDIQLQAADRTGSPDPIQLRIGVNLGDVIIDGDDIYGDGVNIAARLEPLAEPGGVCVSSIVNESVGPRVNASFEDGGEVSVKNIDRPIRIWKWHPTRERAASAIQRPAPGRESSMTIAVLPFANVSNDPEQEYFSDGITEDIMTDLSKVGGLAVVARNSAFAYKGRSVDVRDVGRELGANRVLEGSIRRSGQRVRINAQLIDTANAQQMWAERFDRELIDIFDLQDEVTRRIVEALRIQLSPAESAEFDASLGTTNVEAHDRFLRGRALYAGVSGNRDKLDEARRCFERAVELDPQYGDAYAGLAYIHSFAHNNNWQEDDNSALTRAHQMAIKAVQLAPGSVYAQNALSMTSGFSGDFERCRTAVNAALAISPHDATALFGRGALSLFTGDPLAALPDIERAIQIDPLEASQYRHYLGMAHLFLGQYENAVAQFRERIAVNPETDLTRTLLASALGSLGRIEEARQVWGELKALNPAYSFKVHIDRLPFRDRSAAASIAEGLRKAGLIE